MCKILIVIPARGGSKGIPRKNLRSLNGRPLISFSIATAQRSQFLPDVYVSSDDEEILSIAGRMGAKLRHRVLSLSSDATTLDPVIYDVYQMAIQENQKNYDAVVTLQPTSPLLKTSTLDSAISFLLKTPSVDTVISAANNTHLTWRKEEERFSPNYEKRVNRQFLPQIFKETGGFLITRPQHLTPNSRIGPRVHLALLSKSEGIDIDDHYDWALCEYFLRRKKILFVVTGNATVGLGHVYNTLIMASDIMNHDIQFLADEESQLAFEKISAMNFPVIQQNNGMDLVKLIETIGPDLVINDRLDTTAHYIKSIRSLGVKVINIEDLGEGARDADLVINAIYPEEKVISGHYFGQDYFLIRDEFLIGRRTEVKPTVKNILITFGGVDPNNYTLRILSSVYEHCLKKRIKIDIVAGLGYDKYETLVDFDNVNIFRDVKNISEYMSQADLIFTSAGRTVYEIAALGIPAIVLAQNDRELLHFFANHEYGFVNLGLGTEISNDTILEQFVTVSESYEKRCAMSDKMKMTDFHSNRKRVNDLVNQILEA